MVLNHGSCQKPDDLYLKSTKHPHYLKLPKLINYSKELLLMLIAIQNRKPDLCLGGKPLVMNNFIIMVKTICFSFFSPHSYCKQVFS